jgi:hypothetical protein
VQLDDNTLKCWGMNLFGELGQGNYDKVGMSKESMGDFLPAIDVGKVRDMLLTYNTYEPSLQIYFVGVFLFFF